MFPKFEHEHVSYEELYKAYIDCRKHKRRTANAASFQVNLSENLYKLWVDLIVDWLKKDANHHLVVYEYDTTTYNRCVYDELMDIEDEKKDELMKRLGIIDSNLENQIHIPVGYDIFNFEFKKVEENTLPQSFNVFDTMADSSKSFSYK